MFLTDDKFPENPKDKRITKTANLKSDIFHLFHLNGKSFGLSNDLYSDI